MISGMSTTTLGEPDLDQLRRTVTGPVFLPGDDGYDEERAGFNLAVQQEPAVIVGAVTAEDVAAAVRFAADRRMPISVHATGHGGAGHRGEDAMMISTRRYWLRMRLSISSRAPASL